MLRLLAAFCLLFSVFPALSQAPQGRLPRSVIPTHYDLTLTIVPQRDGFSGQEAIAIQIREPVEVIWIHGQELHIQRSQLVLEDGEALAIDYEQVNATGLVRLALPRAIQPQSATLRFAWKADYSTELDGLYKVIEAGKAYVFSQFEPISARKVFPSFDEPRFKTPFKISLIVDQDHKAITATPAVAHKPLANGLVQIDYAKTKPLPTYLLAFAVGPLDVVRADPIPPNAVRSRPLPLRGVAVAGKGEQLQYALKHTGAILTALERYTGIAYPYRKLDLIAVPNFAAGAMENVGAITFREYLILLDKEAPLAQKRSYASVMAHELAHFWFGNLVTVPWWDDIWLNEAFATWLGAKGMDAVWPEYRAKARLFERILNVMDADSLVSARRIREPIENADDIYNAFDSITYVKGAAILGMFEHFLGQEAFRQGVHNYLKSHAHGTGDYQDFIAAVGQAAGRDIKKAFESFLNQSGLPFVAVSKDCNNGEAVLELSQSRYLPLGSSGGSERTWRVPVCLRFGNGERSANRCLLMKRATTQVELNFCPTWILPNAGGNGYYRWSLENDGYAALLARDGHRFELRERMSIADNIDAAVRAGRLPFDEALPLLAQYADSSDPLLADAPMDLLRLARQHLAESLRQRERVERRAQALYAQALERMALLPSSEPTAQALKETLLGFLLFSARAPELRKITAAQGHAWIRSEGKAPLDPALLATVLGVTVQERGFPAFQALAALLNDSLNANQRRQVLAALGHANDPHSIEALHALIFSEALRSNEIQALLRVQSSMLGTRLQNWRWIKNNFDRLIDVMPAGHAGNLPAMTAGFCSQERAEAVQAFFEPRIEALQGGPRNLAQALEQIRICAAVVEHQRPHFVDWLGQDATGELEEPGFASSSPPRHPNDFMPNSQGRQN